MDGELDFAAVFARLAAEGAKEHHAVTGGVDVRLVRVEGGAQGRWDSHPDTPETVVVWAGTFEVAYRDRTLVLRAGQGCVVPAGVEHMGSSPSGAQVILFKNVAGS